MNLEDFVKELAVKLNKDNFELYRRRAASLVIDKDMDIDSLSKLINSTLYYDDLLGMFDSKKEMMDAVKRVMKETDVLLTNAREFYRNNKKSFGWFNKTTKDWLASPSNLIFFDMTDKVVDHWLNNPNSDIYTDTTTTNHFFNAINTNNKKFVTKIINHKNFKKIPSFHPLVSLLTTRGYEDLLTKSTFDKVFLHLVSLMNKYNVELIEVLTHVINHPLVELKYIEILPTEQQVSIYEYVKHYGIALHDDIMKFFFDITGDTDMLPSTAKDIFKF